MSVLPGESVVAEVRVTLEAGHERYELAAAIGRALNTLHVDGVILRGYSVGTSAAEPLNIGLGERL